MNIPKLDLASGPLYFLHIPKTAGTTLISELHSWFSAEEVCPAYLWHDLLAISPETLAKYRLFRGHFYYYLHRVLPVWPQYITFLRDPVQRTLSHYEHICRESGHYYHQRALAQNGLMDFLRDPETSTMVTNFQTRSLALDLDPRQIAATLDQQQINKLMLEQILESTMPGKISNQVLLDLAKARLAEFVFIGLAERFEESVKMMSWLLGVEPSNTDSALNISPERAQRQHLSARALDLIRENTQLDMQLYEYGKTLFAAQLSRMAVK